MSSSNKQFPSSSSSQLYAVNFGLDREPIRQTNTFGDLIGNRIIREQNVQQSNIEEMTCKAQNESSENGPKQISHHMNCEYDDYMIIQEEVEISTTMDEVFNDNINVADSQIRKRTQQSSSTIRVQKKRALMSDQEKLEYRAKDKVKKQLSRQHQAVARKQNLKYFAAAYSDNVELYRLGPFTEKCIFCHAVFFPQEHVRGNLPGHYFSCCSFGKNSNIPIPTYPEELKHFFTAAEKENELFFENIRELNSSFACASLSAFKTGPGHPSGNVTQAGFPYCYRLQGQVFHKMNVVAQPMNAHPSNGQLFFVDTKEALEHRATGNLADCKEIIEQCELYLRENYHYAQGYKMMREVIEEQEQIAIQAGKPISEVKLLFSLKKGSDLGRYNLPKSNEICAIIVCNSDGYVEESNIVIHSKGDKQMKNLRVIDPNVEPMMYPLFYPNADRGWHINYLNNVDNKISMCDYAKYFLYKRFEIWSPIHYGRKLFQQWCVDQVARVESTRLSFIREHQTTIKAAQYENLTDYLNHRADTEQIELGRKVILPSTFTGGQRDKEQSFMDAMTMVSKFGKPDLFITMTCNPSDPDILEAIATDGHNAANWRPDIVTRVFKLKKDELIKRVVNDGIFGPVLAYCWVIEFQKRGLPHMHMLVTLQKKWKTKEEIDKYIKSELPDPNEDKELHELVKAHMMHGPCEYSSKKNGKKFGPCWNHKERKCSKKYPRKFLNETHINDDGYPTYRRRDNGRSAKKKGIDLDNRYVVPYNPHLLKAFRCHINVEVVSNIKAIKYLFKYIYKGFDAATVEIQQYGQKDGQKILHYDEINQYLDARYLSPCEACWRLLKFDLQGKSHPVVQLPVHLPDKQPVYFQQGAKVKDVKAKLDKKSKLMAFFQYNLDNPTNRVLYPDMPTICTWKNGNEWVARKTGATALGRIYTVNPKNSELYHLRLLLCYVPGPTCYEDLLENVDNGTMCQTFKESCLKRGLIKDDDEWRKCLSEASLHKFPNALRKLFAMILIHCSPTYPDKLWEEFRDEMCIDLVHANKDKNLSAEHIYELCLIKINQFLFEECKDLSDFNQMPQLREGFTVLAEEIDVDKERDEFLKLHMTMNLGQQAAVHRIIQALSNDSISDTRSFFLNGPGGTGKTFVYRAIYHFVRSLSKKAANVAFSGIAATLLKQGTTLHTRFKLPLNLDYFSRSSIELGSKAAKDLQEIDAFIWDEAPMAPKHALNIISELLQEIMKNGKFFGAKIMLLGGDFRQLLPILQGATRTEIIDLTLKSSSLWSTFEKLHLTENMRADPFEREFAQEVLAIGEGRTNDVNGKVRLPDKCYTTKTLVEEIFEPIIQSREYGKLGERAILASYNSDVDSYNQEILDMLPGEYVEYLSIDTGEAKDSDMPIMQEILNSLDTPGMPKHRLLLKINAIIMLLRNMIVMQGFCNGTRLKITSMQRHVLRCLILTGDKAGEEVFIPRITLIEDKKLPYVLRRHQFPVRLAFSMTVHKSQGQTFDKIGIDFIRQPFAHGQFYTSVSRVRSWDCLKVVVANDDKDIDNVVYTEILDSL